MIDSFDVKGKKRLEELKVFLGTNVPSATFVYPILFHPNNDYFEVTLKYDIASAGVVETLHNKWRNEDSHENKDRGILYRLFHRKIS